MISYHSDDGQGNPVVEAAVLHCDSHDQAAEEHVVGRVQVVDRHLASGHHAQQRQSHLHTNLCKVF